ncbi:hypothetical protein HDU76_005514 [Blyttiomyces sp. JEL0837]|nr:hypothetical protein HDU76_005514 [Blyttiomyces sp. JEL0837]
MDVANNYFNEGNHQRASDGYKSIYLKYPGSFAGYNAISNYCRSFENTDGIKPTEDDLNLLKNVEKGRRDGEIDSNIEIPKWERMRAAICRGFINWQALDRQAAVQRFRKAVELGESISISDREKLVMSGYEMITVQQVLDKLIKVARANVASLEGKIDNVSEFMATNRLSRDEYPVDEISKWASHVRGAFCDGCNKTREEAGGKLKHCGRCKREYYCSEKCQKAAWKRGHQKTCREPYVFKVKDIAILTGIGKEPSLNEKFVEIMKKVHVDDVNGVDDGDRRWEVKILGTDRDNVSVKGRNMMLIVPVETRKRRINVGAFMPGAFPNTEAFVSMEEGKEHEMEMRVPVGKVGGKIVSLSVNMSCDKNKS